MQLRKGTAHPVDEWSGNVDDTPDSPGDPMTKWTGTTQAIRWILGGEEEGEIIGNWRTRWEK